MFICAFSVFNGEKILQGKYISLYTLLNIPVTFLSYLFASSCITVHFYEKFIVALVHLEVLGPWYSEMLFHL